MAVAESSARPRPVAFLWRAVRPDVPFHVLIVGFVAFGLLLHALTGYPGAIDLSLSWELLGLRALIYAIPALVAALAWALIRQKRSLRSAETWRSTLGTFFEPLRTSRLVLAILVLPPFMSAFVEFKAAIPRIHPFSLDTSFMLWDQWLHFGQHPWVLLQPLLGTPAATAFIDFTYSLWFAVLWLTVIWQVWHGDYFSDAREQFMLSMVACWIVIGVGFATLLSSAGPVYYGAVTGAADPFVPLMEYLREVNGIHDLKALWIQDVLWQSYVEPASATIGEGISAMPSMHVSMAVLMALVGFRVNRWVGWAYTLFGLLIIVGSVHLAWHYAIDGYVAAVLTVIVWWACGKTVRAWNARVRTSGHTRRTA